MPLDARKIAHIQQMLPRVWSSRQKTVVFVYHSAGVYRYVAHPVIFRPQAIIDPSIPDSTGEPPRVPTDLILLVALSVPLQGVVLIADTAIATRSAVASVPRYQIIESLPAGIIPGGTHYRIALRRLR